MARTRDAAPVADDPGNGPLRRSWRRFTRIGWSAGREGDRTETRALLVRILIAGIWIPVQVTLSLLFATGGILLLLILGLILGPVIGLVFLVRHLVRGAADERGDAARAGSSRGPLPPRD